MTTEGSLITWQSGWRGDTAQVLPPVPAPDTLERERLNAVLEAATRRPLTVLLAPTGYGKTVAVAAWLAASQRPVAWLALDRQDDDPRALMLALIGAYETVLGAGALDEVAEMVRASTDLALLVVPRLVELIAAQAAGGVVLVLDDYHEIQRESVHELVQALLNTLAPTQAVVICTRTKPPLRLSRRLAAQQASVIGASQLAFTDAETAQLFNDRGGLSLSTADLDTVERGVGGWPLGLSLLGPALQTHRQTGHRDITAALGGLAAGPVLEDVVTGLMMRLPQAQRRLRVRTSVLERVNGPLATAMVADATAPALLEQWREHGEFVVADDGPGGWLTCHPLVRRALLVALEREEPGVAAAMHRRASRWFEADGQLEAAIHHALAGGPETREHLAELLSAHGLALVLARRTSVITDALELIAQDGRSNPIWDALRLLLQFVEGAHTPAMVEHAWELHRRHGHTADVGIITATMVGSPLVGDVGAALTAGTAALGRFGDVPGFMAGLAPGLAACLMLAGRMSEARGLVEPLVAGPQESAEILAHTYLGWVCLAEGDRTVAEWHGRCAVELLELRFGGTRSDLVWVRAVLADALRVNGKLAEARAQLDRSLETAAPRLAPMIQGLVLVSDAELALAEIDRARARSSAERARRIFAGCVDVGSEPWRRLAAVEAGLATPKGTVSVGSVPTSAEVRVLELLAVTPNRGQIAHELGISESTVKTHLRRIYKRLGAANREEALAAARARGLLG